MSDESEDQELKGLRNPEKATFVDRLRSKFEPKIDRNDAGQVTYPRRDFLQNQIDARIRAEEEERRRKQGK